MVLRLCASHSLFFRFSESCFKSVFIVEIAFSAFSSDFNKSARFAKLV